VLRHTPSWPNTTSSTMSRNGQSLRWPRRTSNLVELCHTVSRLRWKPCACTDLIASQYPYGGAKINGLPGSQIGNIQVPAPGDVDHQYQDPPPGAFRGPCPGLNAAANHGFLSRDGIVTFNELVAAQQNVYNVGYDLAVVLATLGVGLDGKSSITFTTVHC
jgi:hypothetical protein